MSPYVIKLCNRSNYVDHMFQVSGCSILGAARGDHHLPVHDNILLYKLTRLALILQDTQDSDLFGIDLILTFYCFCNSVHYAIQTL